MHSPTRATVIEITGDELERRLAEPDAAPDQRQDSRVTAEFEVAIPLPSWDQARRVYTCNISRGGLMFRIAAPVTLPGHARVVLTLPDGSLVALPSEIRHAARDAETGDVEVGVQFRSLTPEVEQALRAALATTSDG